MNPTAKLILELCDGTLTAAQIAGLIEEAFGLPETPGTQVEDALATLETEGLVQ